jgi:hypothetical protein
MTSERQIAANRRNSRKSRGPRTAAGKSIASRNALRHGVADRVYGCDSGNRKKARARTHKYGFVSAAR